MPSDAKLAQRRVLVADVPQGMSLADCIEALKKKREDFNSHHILVLRPPVNRQYYFPDYLKLVEHIPYNNIPIDMHVRFLLSADYQPSLGPVRFDGTARAQRTSKFWNDVGWTDERWLEEIKSAEFEELVVSGLASFPEIPGFAYETPSRRKAKGFLRAGNIQTSRGALDGIFFWLLPRLKDANAILADTWTIGSTALNVARRLEDYSEGEISPAVEIVSGYFTDQKEREKDLKQRLECLKDEIAPGKKTLKIATLLSVFSSGSLYYQLREMLPDYGQDPGESITALFNLPGEKEGPKALIDYSNREEYQLAPDTASPIKIDPRAFFVLRQIDRPLPIYDPNRPNFIPFKMTLSDKGRQEAIILHGTHPTPFSETGERHQAIGLDTLVIASDPVFRNAFRGKVQASRKTMESRYGSTLKAVVHPNHAAGRILAEIAQQELGLEPHDILPHDDLRQSPDKKPDAKVQRVKALGEKDAFLVVDDVFISGSRMTEYIKGLREMGDRPDRQARGFYLVGTSRPDDLESWDALNRNWGWTNYEDSRY